MCTLNERADARYNAMPKIRVDLRPEPFRTARDIRVPVRPPTGAGGALIVRKKKAPKSVAFKSPRGVKVAQCITKAPRLGLVYTQGAGVFWPAAAGEAGVVRSDQETKLFR